jgi:hypothetical protein
MCSFLIGNILAISDSRKERQGEQHIVNPKYLQSFILQYDSLVTQLLYYFVSTANITLLFSVGQCRAQTEKLGSSDKDSHFYPRGDWFEFRPGSWLLWLRFFVVFLSIVRQYSRYSRTYMRLIYGGFIPNNFQLFIHSYILYIIFDIINSELLTTSLNKLQR